MVIKVLLERIVQDHVPQDGQAPESSSNDKPNVSIRVKDTDTLDYFKGESFCNPQFFEKITRWIKKKKYECKYLNNNSEVELRVEIFKFNLKKVPKTEVEILKQEICAMKKDNTKMKGELKMFRYYYLNMWKDRSRMIIQEKPDLKQELIESP